MPTPKFRIYRRALRPLKQLLWGTALLLGGCAAWHAQDARPPTSELVRDADVVIETLVQGSGPAIVLLPSLGRDGVDDFNAVSASLAAAGFKVLRPQPRGVRSSSGPMTGQDLYSFAQDVSTVIDRLGNGRAIIVGHAFGHFVARMTATRYPAKVRGVVLAAASARDTGERFPDIWATPVIAGDVKAPAAQRLEALRRGFFAAGNDPAAWLEGWYPEVSKMQREKAVPTNVWWGAGAAPLLEIIPEEDPFKPRDRWEELRVEYGTRVTIVTIPRASHALFIEQPIAVAKAIAGWAKGLPQ